MRILQQCDAHASITALISNASNEDNDDNDNIDKMIHDKNNNNDDTIYKYQKLAK